MENNLYYTPEISEFHVGFEYEHLTGFEKEFKPYIYDLAKACLVIERESISHNGKIVKMFIPAMQACIEEKQCRVKTLDQSDIESLGWRFGTNDYVFPENKNVTYGQYKLLFNNSELEIIHLSGTVFRGIIKNKSELIKLMQQLNIK